jgi:hypothetical protein
MQSETATIRLTQPPLAQPLAGPWSRLAYGAAAILAIAGVFTCWCDTPMIWDGAYQFCFSLIQQKPYFYLTRFHSFVLWTPMVLLSHVTTNLRVLKMAYGLPFTLAPAASVLMSWWVVRRRAPHLILWAIFGAAAAPLPGQIFIINDSIFQQHMFWPVFLGLLVPLEWPGMIALLVLAVFQFSHQIGLVLLGGGAAAAALLALGDREYRTQFLIKACVAFALAIVALWKIFHYPDSYAQREFTWEAAHNAWRWGVEGYPLRGLELMWAAGGCVMLIRLLRETQWEKHRPLLGILAALCAVAGAVIWIIWAADAHKWTTAANYRRWVVPLSVPFYFFAFLDQFFKAGKTADLAHPPAVRVGYLMAATFAVVLSIQSVVWVHLTRRLMRDVETYPAAIVPWRTIAWTQDTALYHWGTASYVFVLEGQSPRHLVLDPEQTDSRKQFDILNQQPPAIPLSSFTAVKPTPGPAGWFDFTQMLKAIDREDRVQKDRMQNAK